LSIYSTPRVEEYLLCELQASQKISEERKPIFSFCGPTGSMNRKKNEVFLFLGIEIGIANGHVQAGKIKLLYLIAT